MSTRIRQSVYNLPSGDETLLWYGRAVADMRSRALSDPTSWWYMGAVHGNPNLNPPAGANQFWEQCQHQSWYFLPWHRGYLAAFEAMVSKAVAALGGPADWALPYWNYSEDLAQNPEARFLPPAFRDQTLPDGSDNPLFAPRVQAPGGDIGLGDGDVALDALDEDEFTPAVSFETGFGGPRTGFSHFGSANGQLERVPHNVVHVRINGWMADPRTAAFDPIFWLHHCNIDRLWEEWRAADSSHTNPDESAWLSGVTFDMHDGDGTAFTFTAGDMVDTTQILHGYRYDTIPTPSPVVVAAGRGVPEMVAREPELAGSSQAPVSLEDDLTSVRVQMQSEGVRRSFTESAFPTPVNVYLRLEEVTGKGVPADYEVLVDLEDDDEPPYPVGRLSTFGIAGASDTSKSHGGTGITEVYNITRAAERLRLTVESTPKLRVSFRKIEQRPVSKLEMPGPVPVQLPDTEASSIQVGRIGIYFD